MAPHLDALRHDRLGIRHGTSMDHAEPRLVSSSGRARPAHFREASRRRRGYLMFLPESQIHFYIDRPLRQWHSRDLYKDGANPTDVVLPVASEPYYVMTSIDFLPRFEVAQGEVKVLDQGMRTSRHVYSQDRLVLLEYRPKSAEATAAKAAASVRK